MPPMSSTSVVRSRSPASVSENLNMVNMSSSHEKHGSSFSSQNTTRQIRRKVASVTFAPTDELQEIPHLSDLSDEEVADVWMTAAELDTIRRQCSTIVKFIDSAIMDTTAKHGVCLRGLEQNTPSYVSIQMAVRAQLYDAVFYIQHFQRHAGVAVPNLIAETCKKFSSKSVAQAHAVGLNDQTYVESAYANTTTGKKYELY